MDRIALLKNPVQEYAWGSRTAIPSLMGLPVPSERPAAELWLGAHPKAPSRVWMDGGWEVLDKVIASDPVSVMGKRVADQFGNTLPFLFKVLAADSPLSIQVHPNIEQARAGYERETHLGIPLDADDRNYKDPNHKPELLCAIMPFEALKGFRPPEDVLSLLGRLSGGVLSHELSRLKENPDRSGLKQLFTSLLSMDPSHKKKMVEQATEHAVRYMDTDRAFWWMVEFNRVYPGDIGVLSPLIFNLVALNPGEAIYIPAGVPHTYLKGMGMELMANSDNVLRGGLTPKHVDVPELLKTIDFSPSPVQKIRPQPGGQPAERIYKTPASEFQLSEITVSHGVRFISQEDRSVEIAICMEGHARIRALNGGKAETLAKGVSSIIPASVGPYQIEGEATLYKAMVGSHL